ncbi:MAG: winged helix-turn-helix transcriptional regulator [Desulfarculus sp.]|nr:winged helix-turn-helix transcriptional regulator [Desulfarculus sp.]
MSTAATKRTRPHAGPPPLDKDTVPEPGWPVRLPRLAAMGKGLADPNRLRLVLALAQGRKPVGRLVEELGLSQPLVSHHLKELRLAGLLKVEREGPFVFYEIAGPQVLEALRVLASLARAGAR